MAEPVYKKITELDVLSGALDGNETLPVVKSGKTYKRSWANFFGTGWITSLLGAFTAFKAPDADHADDADTVGGETAAQLHAAASLTGAIHLDRIPAELTGKNAATATTAATASSADKLTTARTIGGVAFDGSANVDLPGVNMTGNQDTTGNAGTATGMQRIYGEGLFLGGGCGIECNLTTGAVTFLRAIYHHAVPSGCVLIRLGVEQ